MRKYKDREKKKRMFAAAIAILIAVIMIISMAMPFFAAYGATTDIALTGEVGFDGKYRVESEVPVKILAENPSANAFSGEIQIKIKASADEYDFGYYIYASEMELPAGGKKEIEMSISLPIVVKELLVEYVDKDGKSIASINLAAKAMDPLKSFGAILSDAPENVRYLHEINISNAEEDRLVNIEQLPSDYETLRNFDLIIINDYDTTKLDAARIASLKAWVNQGGTLVIGTGANYNKVMAGLSELITATKIGETRLAEISDINLSYNKNIQLENELELSEILLDGGVVDLSEGEHTLSQTVDKLPGHIIVHNFDLGLSPAPQVFKQVDTLGKIYRVYFRQLNTNPMKYNQEYTYLANNLPEFDNKTVEMVFIIVMVYAIIIGGVLYFILKKMGKSEYAFLVIPAMSVAVTVMIFIIGLGSVYRKPIVNTLSSVNLESGETTAKAFSTIAAFSPNSGTLKLDFKEGITPKHNIDIYGYGGRRYNNASNSERPILKMKQESPVQFVFYNNSTWQDRMVTLDSEVQLGNGISGAFYFENDKIKGEIQNNSGIDLKDVIVNVSNNYKKIGEIKNGATVKTEMEIKTNNAYLMQGQSRAVLDVFLDGRNDLEIPIEELRQITLKQRLIQQDENNVGFEYEPAQRTLAAKLYAFSDVPLVDTGIMVNGKTPYSLNQTIFVVSCPIKFGEGAEINLPFGFTPLISANSGSGYSWEMGTDFIYTKEAGTIDFMFKRPGNFKVTSLELDVARGENIYIYNAKTAEYEIARDIPYTTKPEDYIDEEGNIRLQYFEMPAGEVPYPRVAIKGVAN